jgi:hypothetical protein
MLQLTLQHGGNRHGAAFLNVSEFGRPCMVWNAILSVCVGVLAIEAESDSPTGSKAAEELVEKVLSALSVASPVGAMALVAIASMALAGFAIYAIVKIVNRKK